MKMHLEEFEKSALNGMEHVAVQLLAYKDDRTFLLKNAINTEVRIDTVNSTSCIRSSRVISLPNRL